MVDIKVNFERKYTKPAVDQPALEMNHQISDNLKA